MAENGDVRPGGIGAAMPRKEDRRLLTGRGGYTSDFTPDGLAFAAVVRSSHAHAEITAIEPAEARALPGVLAVLTGADAAADGLQPMPHDPVWSGPPDAELTLPDGFEVYLAAHDVLPADRVRYVGEPVAFVVAESAEIAADAAERVEVTYAPRAAVVDARAARAVDAPRVWPECAGNLSLACEVGNAARTEEAFAEAAHIVDFETWVQRITGGPMEPRAAIGEYDPARDHYTLRAASGRGAVQTRDRLATILGIAAENCRVLFGDMGGNFGTRNAFSPEFALVAWASRRVGRPVKWTASRNECFLSDYQGRDLAVRAALALDAEGRFLGLRGANTMNLGAYTVYFWPLRKGLSIMQGVYDIPAVHFTGEAVFTNTPPVAVYRSAGRPEAIFVIERLIDLAAEVSGIDRIELRRRNLIPSAAMPFTTAVGVTYDSGDYPAGMERALQLGGWDGFAARRAESASRGLCRGIALANYIEVTSGLPRERAELTVAPNGGVELVVGTASSGQGHETSYAQLVADWLGVPFEAVRYVANDTARVSVGGGSHSGRSMRLASIAISQAIEDLVAHGTKVAGREMQAPEGYIVFRDGVFHGPGGASLDLASAARAAGEGLTGIGDITDRAGGYPSGSHVCEVEVDPATGEVRLLTWTGVDDVGRAVNPLILHGQAQGAIAQGLGQALMEAIHYEPETAQLLTGSFMDYAMPRADSTPPMRTALLEVPASSHPHGIRPGGEGGTTPALAVVINAIVDALGDYGVRHVEMPATPERVWRAIRAAQNNSVT